MTDGTGSPLRSEVAGGVATLVLDAPASRNALSSAMLTALQDGLAAAADDAAARLVVLTHSGTTFCAGVDLREALEAGMERSSRQLVALFRAMLTHPKPVVAVVDGHVRAGGLGLLGACDVVLAGPRSTFAFTEARLGLAPMMISLVCTPRLSDRAAGRLYLTGETVDATAAQAAGLVTAVDDPAGALAELVVQFRECSPQGLAESKRLVTAHLVERIDTAGEELAARSAALFASEEAREGMRAFRERRAPRWAAQEG